MNIIYETSAVSTGGRDGKVVVENSPLKFEMALPSEIGGKKIAGVNPEQLFAAGYSACFGSSMQFAIRNKKISIPDPTVKITVGMGKNDAGGFALSVEIVATLYGIDQELADAILKEAHNICPYSNAIKGNVEVSLIAKIT